MADLLAIKTTEYSQFVELKQAADKYVQREKPNSTIVCSIRLHLQNRVSALTLLWHPVSQSCRTLQQFLNFGSLPVERDQLTIQKMFSQMLSSGPIFGLCAIND